MSDVFYRLQFVFLMLCYLHTVNVALRPIAGCCHLSKLMTSPSRFVTNSCNCSYKSHVTDDKKQTSIEQHVTEVSTDDQGPIYKES